MHTISNGGDNMLKMISTYLSNLFGIKEIYIYLCILSLIGFCLMKIIKMVFVKMMIKRATNDKQKYEVIKRINIICNTMFILFIIFLWNNYLGNIMTFITFLSASFTIALRDMILNFFAGIYIKLNKLFNVEDRIEIDHIKGDVINIHSMSFDVLEINDIEHGEQSSGIIITIPNNFILTHSLKNYNKAFKYIWQKLHIKVSLDTDIKKAKGILYKIVNENPTITRIPGKMKKQLDKATGEYRIYFNRLKPVIYTKVVDDHIELSIRYLMHPKKNRNVLDELWTKILIEYQKNNIMLVK